MDAQDSTTVIGFADGYQHGHISGWAWYPERPHETVVVQVLANGEVVAEGAACIPRPDLKTAGIGHGRHAFSIPFAIDPAGPALLHMVVRAKDGPVLAQGEFDIETSPEAREAGLRRRSLDYLEQVFGPFTAAEPPARAPRPAPVPPVVHFVLYSATGGASLANALGAPQYSYYFVMREFRAVLRRLGVVHVVAEPAEADAIYARCLERGEGCLLLSFAPPQSTVLGLRCPTIPVIAWEFSTIPNETWDENRLNDWRVVLRQTGRAITISAFAARAVRAGMGADFPVAFLPTPVWDRLAGLRARLGGAPAGGGATLLLDGFTWDSRRDRLELTMHTPPLPRGTARPAPQRSPMGAAALQLALASAAEQQAAHARAAEAQRAAAEAERAAAAARAAAEPPARKSMRHRAGITARLAIQWYRDVLRDLLPGPVTKLMSTGGRVAKALRAPRPPQEQVALEPPAAAPALPAETLAVVEAVPAGSAKVAPSFGPEAPPVPDPALALFDPDPFPAAAPAADPRTVVTLDGTIFTTVFAPKDGRKNWQDILTAFTFAFADQPDATLVMKMIGTDPSYWWWEFHELAKTLPPYACRVLVLQGFLDDTQYQALIQATHFVVNASLAEGQCLPLVEFMSASRPAIAPCHTAMLDYIRPENAIVVASAIEFCSWPQDPRNQLNTTRHRIEWPSMRDAFCSAWRILHDEPDRYQAMGQAAAATMRAYCADDVVGPQLAAFLGLGEDAVRHAGWQPIEAAPVESLA